MSEHVKMFIGGAWVDAEDGATFDATSPSTGAVGSRMTAAATTGPARGPRPTSSTPATQSPRAQAPRSWA